MDYKNINDYELVYRIREDFDDDSVEMMIKKYEPIICNCAKKYIQFIRRYGFEMDDLVQIGRMAVAKAVKSFDQDKGVTFYTYVTVCIERNFMTCCRNLSVKKNQPLNYCLSDEYLYNVRDDSANTCGFVTESVELENIFALVREKFNFVDNSIFELRYNGFSYREISELLDVSFSFVDSRLCKIRKTLQGKKSKFLN